MENKSLDKVEDSATVPIRLEKMQPEKCDSLTERYVSELWDFTRIDVTQYNLQELKEIWVQWNDEIKQLFYCNYGHVDEVVLGLFDRFVKRVTSVPSILVGTFRYLNVCRRRCEVEQIEDSKSYLSEVAIEQIKAINLIPLKFQ
ncbi:hypothetical protein PVK06_007063 [Gossypium arboreum]|uniref:Uncharacterized protein n=1 Tax=Gossypium arboreum TaxID=29729 RepID=A0ABR0QGH4_GOSAR|nr:hypothetical protein PVK06_007063 [Gossypium arboreum]